MERVDDESLEWTLIRRSLTEELTAEERQQLETWLNESSDHRRYYDRITGFNPSEGIPGLSKEQYEEDFTRYVALIRKAKQDRKKKRFIVFARYAALLIVLLAVGIYFWYTGTSAPATSGEALPLAVQGKAQPCSSDGGRDAGRVG